MPISHVNPGDGSDVFSWRNPDGSVGARFDQFGRRRAGTGAAPTVTAGSGAGTSPSVSVTGTDEFGTVSVTAGTSPAAGALATVTFARPFASAPAAVLVSPLSASAASVGHYASATATGFTLSAAAAPTAGDVYEYSYVVVGGA